MKPAAWLVTHHADKKPCVTAIVVGGPYPDPEQRARWFAEYYGGTVQALYTAEGLEQLEQDAAKYRALNTPEVADFIAAVEREALHQRDRWGADHDAGKTDADWFWLIGYLAGKAVHKTEKRLHHIITTAAACLNWHAAALGVHNKMRPGIEPPAGENP